MAAADLVGQGGEPSDTRSDEVSVEGGAQERGVGLEGCLGEVERRRHHAKKARAMESCAKPPSPCVPHGEVVGQELPLVALGHRHPVPPRPLHRGLGREVRRQVAEVHLGPTQG